MGHQPSSVRSGLREAGADSNERPYVGLSLMPSDDWWIANEPLFSQGVVDAIEWSVDFGWGPRGIPDWLAALLSKYSQRGRLYAHGVELSPLSAKWTNEQDFWLAAMEATCREIPFRHLTEHYGFITAGSFVRGTPLPLPPSRAALDLGVRRIEELRARAGLPIGIENLAFALSRSDVEAQASFVTELVERSDAFVLLDLHNLFCQARNFGVGALQLARAYPLERVREIHVAGGGWSTPATDPEGRRFRRDSHDDRMPNEVFALLEAVIEACPQLEAIILERTDRSLFGRDEAERHREDFTRLRRLVRQRARRKEPDTTRERTRVELVSDDEAALDAYQRTLLDVLDRAEDPPTAKAALLETEDLAVYRDHIATFETRALEIGAALVHQWGAREEPQGTMRAAVLRTHRSPLELRSLPMVEPGPGQVLVRVAAVGLCGTDAHAYRGRFPVPIPIVLGHETVGVVEALGEGVTSLSVGARVGISWIQAGCGTCEACERNMQTRCTAPRTWIENGGGLSEWTIAEASGCTLLPDSLPFELAAPLFCAGHVAMSGLRRAQPVEGERIAVVGLGGLGHLALQIARAYGFETVGVSSSLPKLEDARDIFGAHHVVLVENDDVGAAIDRIGGADIILATTSNMAHAARSVEGLRIGGRLVVMGLGDGALAIDPIELVQREASVIGSIQGSRSDLDEVLSLAEQGAVVPSVETFPLLMAQRAMQRLLEGRTRYRAVVTMD
ncbi:MAG: DUF692 family protein [Polyangiaceae bacterium]|nr:DUF692 family protein [Polyangiaceae bacterium]